MILPFVTTSPLKRKNNLFKIDVIFLLVKDLNVVNYVRVEGKTHETVFSLVQIS